MSRFCAKACYSVDAELVAAMLRGEQRAYRTFYENHFSRLYRFALPRLGGDVEAARDVAQSTLIKASRKLSGYRGQAALATWLFQICRRQVVDLIRSSKHYTKHIVLLDDDPEMGMAVERIAGPVEYHPHEACDAEQMRELIGSVLDALPAPYGAVLGWKYVDGRSVEEIGALLGTGQTAAQSTLARARSAFRHYVGTLLGSAASPLGRKPGTRGAV